MDPKISYSDELKEYFGETTVTEYGGVKIISFWDGKVINAMHSIGEKDQELNISSKDESEVMKKDQEAKSKSRTKKGL